MKNFYHKIVRSQDDFVPGTLKTFDIKYNDDEYALMYYGLKGAKVIKGNLKKTKLKRKYYTHAILLPNEFIDFFRIHQHQMNIRTRQHLKMPEIIEMYNMQTETISGLIISKQKAQKIASDWHGGQWSALYQFASSGVFVPENYSRYSNEINAEIERETEYHSRITKKQSNELWQLRKYFEVKRNENVMKNIASINARVSKFETQYVIQGNYGNRWEDLTYEDNLAAAKQTLKDYDVNETRYPHRMIKRRERKYDASNPYNREMENNPYIVGKEYHQGIYLGIDVNDYHVFKRTPNNPGYKGAEHWYEKAYGKIHGIGKIQIKNNMKKGTFKNWFAKRPVLKKAALVLSPTAQAAMLLKKAGEQVKKNPQAAKKVLTLFSPMAQTAAIRKKAIQVIKNRKAHQVRGGIMTIASTNPDNAIM